jgi:hypothetical protein
MSKVAEKLYSKYHNPDTTLNMYKIVIPMGGNTWRILSLSQIRERVYFDETFLDNSSRYISEGEKIYFTLNY